MTSFFVELIYFTKECKFKLRFLRLSLPTRDRKRTEPKFWKMSRAEPNPNRDFKNSVEPNRTRTHFLKVQPNRTELEPEKFGSFRSLLPALFFHSNQGQRYVAIGMGTQISFSSSLYPKQIKIFENAFKRTKKAKNRCFLLTMGNRDCKRNTPFLCV